jgi:hypothetical protein
MITTGNWTKTATTHDRQIVFNLSALERRCWANGEASSSLHGPDKGPIFIRIDQNAPLPIFSTTVKPHLPILNGSPFGAIGIDTPQLDFLGDRTDHKGEQILHPIRIRNNQRPGGQKPFSTHGFHKSREQIFVETISLCQLYHKGLQKTEQILGPKRLMNQRRRRADEVFCSILPTLLRKDGRKHIRNDIM